MNRVDSAYAESALFDFWMGRFSNKVTSKFFLRISQKQKYNPACNAKTMLTIGCDPQRYRDDNLCKAEKVTAANSRILSSTKRRIK